MILAFHFAVNGGWAHWSVWGECLVTSSGRGQRTRQRSCSNPSPYNGGAYCSGSRHNTKTCESKYEKYICK